MKGTIVRQFNVYSEEIVVHPSEQFQWIVDEAEVSSSGEVTVEGSGPSWPLDEPSYNVTPTAPATAAVNSNAGRSQVNFQCSPPAENVTTQTIIVACAEPFDVCDPVNLLAGDHFFWKNTLGEDVTIKPDPRNAEFWPLPDQQYVVAAGSTLHLQIASDATAETYNLDVTTSSGPACGDKLTGQPKIIVGSSQGEATPAFQSRTMMASSPSGEPMVGQPKIIVE